MSDAVSISSGLNVNNIPIIGQLTSGSGFLGAMTAWLSGLQGMSQLEWYGLITILLAGVTFFTAIAGMLEEMALG